LQSNPPPSRPISGRERVILATVVRGYVASARAVGSRWVARHSGLGLSSASIRNSMMDLEEMGYLTHHHTSGGRVPTNAGYRLFVDELMGRAVLGRRVEGTITGALASTRFGSLEMLLDQACVMLGQLSDQLSVILSPRYDRGVVERIEISQIDEHRILVVFRMTSGLERTVIVGIDAEIDSEDLRQTLQAMNMIAKGKTLPEILESRRDDETRVRLRGLRLAHAIYLGAGELQDGESKDHFHLWGASNMLAQPEFTNRDLLRRILRALEEKEVLSGLLEPTRHRKNVTITIGEENPIEELRDCSVVSVSYRFGEFGGSIGVIGPTRMPYEYVVSLVDFLARTMGKALVHN
jgi:heat-inducible transcriptional repressor